MRASSLSNPTVIDLLNKHFVAVYVSNEDYADGGPAPAEEKKEYRRIYREALAAKLSAGSVHAYVLSPDGHPVDSLHVAEAAKIDKFTAMLRRAVERSQVPAGEPVVAPRAQSTSAATAAGEIVLHVTARNLT